MNLGRLVTKNHVYEIRKITADGFLLFNVGTGMEFESPLSRALMTPFTVMTDDESVKEHVNPHPNITVTPMDLSADLQTTRVFPLSFSSINTFETCPRQFQHLYVLKDVKNEGNEATLWGSKVHKEIEDYINLSKEMTEPVAKKAIPYVELGKEKYRLVEWKWGLTKDFEPCDFFSKDVAYRGVIDFAFFPSDDKVVVMDWKTGKRKDAWDQLDIFALSVFVNFPQVQKVRTMFVWLKTDEKPTMKDYTRGDMDALKVGLQEKADPIYQRLEYGEFPVKPSGLCRGWCPVKSCSEYKA